MNTSLVSIHFNVVMLECFLNYKIFHKLYKQFIGALIARLSGTLARN